MVMHERGVPNLKTHSGILLIITVIALCFVTACVSEPEWPEGLPHGEIVLPNIEDPDMPGAYFDFSEGELVYGNEGRSRGDVFLEATFIAGNPVLNVALAEQQPDSILYDTGAPGWGTNFWKTPPDENTPARVAVRQGYNVWVRTAEGNYGKLKILLREASDDYTKMLEIKMQWIYQPDPAKNDLSASPAFATELDSSDIG